MAGGMDLGTGGKGGKKPLDVAINLPNQEQVRYEDLVKVIDGFIGAGLPNVSVSAAMG